MQNERCHRHPSATSPSARKSKQITPWRTALRRHIRALAITAVPTRNRLQLHVESRRPRPARSLRVETTKDVRFDISAVGGSPVHREGSPEELGSTAGVSGIRIRRATLLGLSRFRCRSDSLLQDGSRREFAPMMGAVQASYGRWGGKSRVVSVTTNFWNFIGPTKLHPPRFSRSLLLLLCFSLCPGPRVGMLTVGCSSFDMSDPRAWPSTASNFCGWYA